MSNKLALKQANGRTMKKNSESKFILSPLMALLITLLLTALSCFVSVSFEGLKEVYFSPIRWDNSSLSINWTPAVFFVLLFVFIGLYFYRAKSSADLEREARENLIGQTEKIQSLVKTMPPKNFMTGFADKYREAHRLTRELSENGRLIKIDERTFGIVSILKSIVRLTKKFDDNLPEDTRVAANIMLYNDSYKKKGEEERHKEYQEIVRFIDDGVDVKNLRGVLVLLSKLSISSDNFDREYDEELKGVSMALPVPNNEKDSLSDNYKVLPGAPWAFCREYCRFSDISELIKWMDEEGDFTESVKSKVRDYFESEDGKHIRSFLSMPIKTTNGESVAVLNIHANKKGLLAEESKSILYYETMKPFLLKIEQIMAMG